LETHGLQQMQLRLPRFASADNLSFPLFNSKGAISSMKKMNAMSLLLAALFVAGAAVASSGRLVDNDIPAPPAIGATVEDFTLPDANGKEQSLSALKGKKGTVLIFVAVQCPVSNAYNERMEKLAQDYKARGINVIGIN